MKRLSLDTPNEVLWADQSDTDRLMRDKPAPAHERVVLTPNGNLVQPKAR